RELLQWIVGQPDFEMFQGNDAFKAQLGRRAFKSSDAHGVIEYIVEQTKVSGFRRDLQTRLDKPQVVTFPGPEHHTMLAQLDRLRVTICRGMSYGEEAHLKKWLRGSAKLCHAFCHLVGPDLKAFQS